MSPDEIEKFCINWPDGTVSAGRPMARIGWRVQIFFRGNGTAATQAALYNIAQEYVRCSQGHLRQYVVGPKEVFRKLKPGQMPDLGALKPDEKDRVSWSVKLIGAERGDDASPWGFQAFASQISFSPFELGDMIAYFPITALDEDSAIKVRALFQRWCEILNAEHGYAGLGWVLPLSIGGQNAAVSYMGPLAMNFPGLDIDLPATTGYQCEEGIRCVAWLTAVSHRLLERSGGAEHVRSLAGQRISLHPYGYGAIFQAGMHPQVGDDKDGLSLRDYRSLARALKPLRAPYNSSIFNVPVSDPLWTNEDLIAEHVRYAQRWLGRFDPQ